MLAGLADLNQPVTFGHDLLPSYVAGRILLNGDARDLYDTATAEKVGKCVIDEANLTGNPHDVRWLNPPFFALLFVPLAALPYRAALLVWMALNAGLLSGALQRLLTRVPAVGEFSNRSASHNANPHSARRKIVLLCAILTSCPFLLAFEHQQNTFISLAILSGAVVAWRGDRPLIAGLLVGLMAFKPQLGIAVGLALATSQGWRAIAGMCISATALLLIGEIFVPGGSLEFVRRVPPIVRQIQSEPSFNWGRHVTPTSFCCALFGQSSQHFARALGLAYSMFVLLVLAYTVWRMRGNRAEKDHLIITAFLFIPLSAVYLMDYDLLLLAIPLVLAANRANLSKRLMVASLLWLAFYFNLSAVNVFRINIAIIAIAMSGAAAVVCGLATGRKELAEDGVSSPAFSPVAPSAT